MVACIVDQVAFLKVLAHAAKFPSNSINGILLGSCAEGGNVEIHDAVPLCHTTISLAPALEIGLSQASPDLVAHVTSSARLTISTIAG
jgi:hypothetical protein